MQAISDVDIIASSCGSWSIEVLRQQPIQFDRPVQPQVQPQPAAHTSVVGLRTLRRLNSSGCSRNFQQQAMMANREPKNYIHSIEWKIWSVICFFD